MATSLALLEKKAGIQAFEKFKYINTVNSLAGGDVTKWGEILALPYERVLTKLLQGLDGDVKSAFLHNLSILIAQVASDGKLTWSDGVYILQWYYEHEYKS